MLAQLRKARAQLLHEREDLQEQIVRCDRQIQAIETLANGQLEQEEDAGGGLATNIRASLRRLGRTCTSAEVAQDMAKNGFEWTGTGELQPAVSTEMWRMAKSNRIPVKRVKRGKYLLEQ